MKRAWHDRILLGLVLCVSVMLLWVVAYQDRTEQAPRAAMRQIDAELIDRQIEDGNLSDYPARHYEVLENEVTP